MKTKIKLPKPRDEVMVYHLNNRFNCGAHSTKKRYNRKDKSWKKDCPSDFFLLLKELKLHFGRDINVPHIKKKV